MRPEKVGIGDAPNLFSIEPPSSSSVVAFSPTVCEWVDTYHALGNLTITTSFVLGVDGLLKYEYNRTNTSPKRPRGARPQSGYIWRGSIEITTVNVVAKEVAPRSNEFRVLQDEKCVKKVPSFYGPPSECPATTVVKSGSTCDSTTEEILENDSADLDEFPAIDQLDLLEDREEEERTVVSEGDFDAQTAHIQVLEMRASDLDDVLYVRLIGSLMPWLPTTPPPQKEGPRKPATTSEEQEEEAMISQVVIPIQDSGFFRGLLRFLQKPFHRPFRSALDLFFCF